MKNRIFTVNTLYTDGLLNCISLIKINNILREKSPKLVKNPDNLKGLKMHRSVSSPKFGQKSHQNTQCNT